MHKRGQIRSNSRHLACDPAPRICEDAVTTLGFSRDSTVDRRALALLPLPMPPTSLECECVELSAGETRRVDRWVPASDTDCERQGLPGILLTRGGRPRPRYKVQSDYVRCASD